MNPLSLIPDYPTLVAAFGGAALAAFAFDARMVFSRPKIRSLRRLSELGISSANAGTASAGSLFLTTCALVYMAVACDQTIVALCIAPVVLAIHGWVIKIIIKRRERLLRNQLADLCQHMAGAVRSNLAPAAALEAAIVASPKGIRSLLSRVTDDYHRGTPLAAALQSATVRLKLDALSLFTTAVGISLEHGSKLDEALLRIANSIRTQQALEDKLQALTASGRASILTMAIFPFAFALFFYRLNSAGYDAAFSSSVGQLVAGASLSVIFLGVWWGHRILDRVGR